MCCRSLVRSLSNLAVLTLYCCLTGADGAKLPRGPSAGAEPAEPAAYRGAGAAGRTRLVPG